MFLALDVQCFIGWDRGSGIRYLTLGRLQSSSGLGYIQGFQPEWCISTMISRVPGQNGVSQA